VIVAAETITEIVTPRLDWAAVTPLLILCGAGLLMLLLSALTVSKPGRGTYAAITVLAAAATIGTAGALWSRVNAPRVHDCGRRPHGRRLQRLLHRRHRPRRRTVGPAGRRLPAA
jgi:hypothetical protein